MTPEETLVSYHKSILEKWVSREPLVLQEMLDFFRSDMSFFGTGLHEIVDNQEGFAQIIKNEQKEAPVSPIIEILWLKAKTINDTGYTWAVFHFKIPVEGQFHEMKNLRMSLSWVKEKDWKVIHAHTSAPWVMQQEGEFFPIKELQARNQELEKMVTEKTAALTKEKEKTEALLHNILPINIAKELLDKGTTKPTRFEEVSILFSDFVAFTNIVATIPTRKLIQELNDLFSQFDDIMEEEGIEKIKTIGDAYLAVSGLPEEVEDHANRCVRAAQKMLTLLEKRNEQSGIKWHLRIGVHSGPIAAGVVGKKKFTYDIFGDTINIASRIETAGEAGKINVSAYTYDLIKEQFPCEYRGKIDVKGKGELDMYFVQ